MAYRVAILTPKSVHGVVGGAENLWAGLERAIRQKPGVEAQWIAFPTPESNLLEVLGSYAHFADLNLDDFDQVITTKYPAWAISHANHVVYLQHTLRGLYDTYPKHLPTELSDFDWALLRNQLPRDLVAALYEASQPQWGQGRRSLAAGWALTDHQTPEATHDANLASRTPLARLCQRLIRLVRQTTQHPADLFAFPGPFARAVLRVLDAVALEPPHVQRYLAISHTVAAREGYFPQGVSVRVVHHPSFTPVSLPAPVHAPRDLVVTASRIEHPKRIDLLIKAYALSGLKWPFWVVGQGPELEALRAYVARKKIKTVVFKGHLSSEELTAAYQRARFVPFAPMQEDYGLITVEAFMAGAPVVTTTDSGGPTELVQHHSTGVLAQPTAKALARAFQALEKDPHATWLMGQEGHQQTQSLQWPVLAQHLLGPVTGSAARRKRLMVLNTFPTEPTVGGGRLRLKGLYTALADHVDVHLLVLAHPHMPHHLKRHCPGFVEELVPVEDAFLQRLAGLEQHVGVSCFDLAAALHPELLLGLTRRAQDRLAWADTAVVSHPYLFPLLERLWQRAPALRRPLVYEAHNVESDLKRGMYGAALDAAQAVEDLEARLLAASDLVLGCSPEDLWYFKEICTTQAIDPPGLLLAPNGMSMHRAQPTPLGHRIEAAEARGYRLAVFMGSGHGPNHDAVALLLSISDQAAALGWRMVVLGSAGWPWLDKDHTPTEVQGVYLAGVVSEAEKLGWLAAATIGLNPMAKGSGTNLKMAEYAAVGLPMVSTAFGARGGLWQPGQHYEEVTQLPNLAQGCLLALAEMDKLLSTQSGRVRLAQRVALSASTAWARLHWQSIADRIAPALPQVLSRG